MSSQPIDLNAVAHEVGIQMDLPDGISVRDVPSEHKNHTTTREFNVNGRMLKRKINAKGEYVRQMTTGIKKEEILRLLLVNKSTRDIATEMMCHITTIRDYIRDPEFQAQLKAQNYAIWARVDEEITLSRMSKVQRIVELGDEALEVIQNCMRSDDERVALKAAVDVLDRNTETSRHAKVDTTTRTIVIDAEKLMLAARTANEIDGPRSSDIDGVREGLPDAT